MTSVLVNGPASWNMLVDLDTLPEARPHMEIARGHRWGLGGTSAGKALNVARLGVPTTLRTVLGSDPDAANIASALAHPGLELVPDVVEGASEHHLNLMSATGERVSIYLDLTGIPPEFPTGLLDALDRAQIAVIDLTTWSLPVLAVARAAGCQIWCDIHDYDGLAAFHRRSVNWRNAASPLDRGEHSGTRAIRCLVVWGGHAAAGVDSPCICTSVRSLS